MKLGNLILAAFAFPFVLLMRVVSPFVTVRIFVLDLSRIAHILSHFDMYVSRRNAGLENPRHFDIFCFAQSPVANYQAKKMVERVIPIWPFAFWVDKVNRRIPGWEKHVVRRRSRVHCDLIGDVSPHLSFTQDELKQGRQELQKLGVPPNQPYICFHSREASYLNTYQPQMNWDYHSYRNADIDNYLPAVEKLVNKGYYALRMGRFVSKKIKTANPQIIDYATKGPTDFMDMYLGAHCRFFISGSDGLAEIPATFRRPFVWIDFIPFSTLYWVANGQLFIPKKLWLTKENRILTFDEMLHTKAADYGRTEDYEKAGIKVINNSPEEIIDVSMELEERVKGTWNETPEDKEFQERFREIVEKKNGRKFSGFIGVKFLRQHKELLGLSSPA